MATQAFTGIGSCESFPITCGKLLASGWFADLAWHVNLEKQIYKGCFCVTLTNYDRIVLLSFCLTLLRAWQPKFAVQTKVKREVCRDCSLWYGLQHNLSQQSKFQVYKQTCFGIAFYLLLACAKLVLQTIFMPKAFHM